MRVRHTINPIITDDAEGKDILFGLDDDKAILDTSAFQRYCSGRFEIDISSSETLSLGDVQDVRAYFIKADGDFNLTLNGTVGPILHKTASTAAGKTARVCAEAQVTQIDVANPSAASVLKGIWCVWGDPSP